MKIFFVRHGEANPEIEGTPLTERGFVQAKQVAKELENYNFDKVYSSDLLRAKQTCESFTQDYIEDSRLREIYRVLIGGPIKEGTSPDREVNDKKRADDIFEELLKNEKDVVVFCHGNIIRYFLNKVLKSKDNLWESMAINNGSISILESNKSGLEIKEINFVDHLNVKNKENIYLE